MKILQIVTVLVVLTSSIGCSQTQDSAKSIIIYYGGDIITMEKDKPEYVEAGATKDGKIVFAGNKAAAFKQFAGKSDKRDLKGKTLIPAFIERRNSWPHVAFLH